MGKLFRRTGVQATIVGLIAFGIYLKTLAPSITGGDSGELIAAAWLGEMEFLEGGTHAYWN